MLRGGGWGGGGIFFFGSRVKGPLSPPDTKLIMPLQLVAKHSVRRLTGCGGPADPEGGIKTLKPSKAGGRLTAGVCLETVAL